MIPRHRQVEIGGDIVNGLLVKARDGFILALFWLCVPVWGPFWLASKALEYVLAYIGRKSYQHEVERVARRWEQSKARRR
jgi:hypothetical protein